MSSSNSQWKSYQPPPAPNINNQDISILKFDSMANNGKTSQSYNFRSNSYNSDYMEKSNSFGSYGSGSNSGRSSGRFPIGTFSFDSYNNTETSTSPSSNNVFTNGNSSSTNYDSNSANLGTRETGIIEKLLHSYGFIQCCERQARLFFHFSQFSGNIEHLKIGDPVEFEMTYDRRTGKPIASTVTKIAPEVVMSEERVTGNVTTELRGDSTTPSSGSTSGDTQGRISYENRGECFFLPYTKDDVEGNVTLRAGDKVSFQIATNQRGNLGACHIRLENPAHPVKYQGVVCSMKESFGFIERADVVKEIFFHFSEAKGMKDELRLGDDVEFTIQTRNGKEVACNITRLPAGTVVFEDVATETVRGQVLKPVERSSGSGNNGSGGGRHTAPDPLPGRVRYRAPDHSEVEAPFGDKDQRGDFTLRHGDWVQFQVATDRRDQLQRATNISLLDESFVVSGEKREQGIVASIKDGFGFLRCVEREPRLFFHFSEVLDVEHDIAVGDEFEFTVAQDQGACFSNTRQSAIRMKRLTPGTVRFETVQETCVGGVVTREAGGWCGRSPSKSVNGSGDHTSDAGSIAYQANATKKTVPFYAKDQRCAPRLGDKVEFTLCQVKRTKELIATDIQVVQAATRSGANTTHQGFIAALKDGFGFIETVEHDREVFFHFSNFEGDASSLELGQEVEYNLGARGTSGSCSSAENVRVLARGTIPLAEVTGDLVDGTVVRPLRSVNPEQREYAGLVRVTADAGAGDHTDVPFGIMGLANKRELLQVGDPVQLQIDSAGHAANIVAVRKKRRATVDAYKGPFGFLTYELEDGKKLFFHVSEVKENATLQVGDTVEFELVTNQRNGKSSACNVTKVSDVQARPERLISRLRTISLEDTGPKLTVVRQPRGPDGSKGFASDMRKTRLNSTSEALAE